MKWTIPLLVLASACCVQANAEDMPAASSTENQSAVGQDIGNTAPEIEGKDIDGKPLKLSDYRGKVVVLDFWGNW